MIGKTTIGKSFGGCVRYVMEKDRAEILDQSGVRSENSTVATKDFNMIRQQNPEVKNAVWHTSVSFAHKDNVGNEQMREIAKDYVHKVGLDNSQYLVVRHHDTSHQHMHIIANRVQYDGNTVNDSFSKNRTARACDDLEVKYGLTIARDQSKEQERINDKMPIRKEVKEGIRSALEESLQKGRSSWSELNKDLKEKGIELKLQKQSTGRINGVSFKKEGLSIKGSAVDKSFSYGRLNNRLEQNRDMGKSLGYEIR